VTVASASSVHPRSSVSTTLYVVVSVGDASTSLALGLSRPSGGDHVASSAPNATNEALSPMQMAVLEGVISATTSCTTTSMVAEPSPHTLTSVTLNWVVPTGGTMTWFVAVRSFNKGLGIQVSAVVPLAMSSISSPTHTGSTGKITGCGGDSMLTRMSVLTGARHPVGSVTVKITL